MRRPIPLLLAALGAVALTLPALAQGGPPDEPVPEALPKAPADGAAPVAAKGKILDPEVRRVLDGIQAFYGEASDLKASFTQTYSYKVYGRKQVSGGKVFFKKPRMMRWDYKTPVAKVFVADGKTLWVYEPEENQAFKQGLADSQLPVALTFMSGEGSLADEFDARLMQSPSDIYTIELIPRRHAGDYQSLLLKVDRETFAVRSSTVIDPVGNSNQVVFTDVKTNAGINDKAFRFSPPEGVRVITEPRR